MNEKSWNTPTLKIGEEITSTIRGFDLAIGHIDRRVDPYLAAVLKNGKVIAWRAKLLRGGKELASRQSYLWD